MKKINNKFRSNNNNSNQIYSLNYKFDSTSIAGKVSGTALDLIKKYNELAKEAHSNNNYVEMEVFRQYAEHYRKIVTDINEKKNLRNNASQRREENAPQPENEAPVSNDNGAEVIELKTAASENAASDGAAEAVSARKEFKVIEISAAEAGKTEAEAPAVKAKRVYRKKAAAV